MRHKIYRFFLLVLFSVFGLIALFAALLKHPATETWLKKTIDQEFPLTTVREIKVRFPFIFEAVLDDVDKEFYLDVKGVLNPFSLFFGELSFSNFKIDFRDDEDVYTFEGKGGIGFKKGWAHFNLLDQGEFLGLFNIMGEAQNNKIVLQSKGSFLGHRNHAVIAVTPFRDDIQIDFSGTFDQVNTFHGSFSLEKASPKFKGTLEVGLKTLGTYFEGDLKAKANYAGIPKDFFGDVSVHGKEGRYLLGHYKNIEATSNFKRKDKKIEGVLALFVRHGGEDFIINTDYTYFKRTLEIENLKADSPSNEITADLTYFRPDDLWYGTVDISSEKLKTLPDAGFGRWKGNGNLYLIFAQEEGKQVISYQGSFAPFSIQTHQADALKFKGTTSPSRPNHQLEVKNYRLQAVQLEDLKLEMITQDEKTSNFSIQAKGKRQQSFEITSEGSFNQDPNRLDLFVETLAGFWGTTPFELVNPTQISVAGDFPYFTHFSAFRLKMGEGTLHLDLGDEKLFAEMDKVPFSLLQILFPALPLEGKVNGRLGLAFSKEKPIGDFEIVIKNLISTEPNRKVDPVDLDLKGLLMEGNPEISLTAIQNGSSLLKIWGDLPLSPSLRPLPYVPFKFDLEAREEVLPFVNLFLNEENQIRGQAKCDFSFQGPLTELVIDGYASLENGYFINSFLGFTLEEIQFTAKGENNLLRIDDFQANDKHEGKLAAQMQIQVDEGLILPLLANFNLNQFRLISRDEAKIDASGNANIRGTFFHPAVSGELLLTKANFNIPEELPIDIPLVPYRIKGEKAPASSPVPSPVGGLNFDRLQIKGEVPLSVQGRGLTSLWQGEVAVSGLLYQPKLEGEMTLKEGHYIFSGRRFSLDEGKLTFNGLPKEAYLLVSGTTSIRDELITAKVQGPLSDPATSFSSKGGLEIEEVLSLVLFEKPIDQITPLEGLQLAQTALSLSDKKGLSFIGKLKNRLGLDLINIYHTQSERSGSGEGESSQVNEVSLRAGKYLSKGLFIGVDRNFNTETNSFLLEILLPKHLRIEAEINDDSDGKVELKWKKHY